ncbi:MAG: hypothetical protein GX040_03220 [Alcaligenaceae bacterium]|nr:hypothetical protein [Alcaligenaceae bacterium]
MEKTSSNVVKQTKPALFSLLPVIYALARRKQFLNLPMHQDWLQNSATDKTAKPLHH